MTGSTHTDITYSSCNTIATSLTECDHCRKWLCQSYSKLPKYTLNKMTALHKSGFYWNCTKCRTDPRPSQRNILSNRSSQTSPLPSITIIPLHLHPTYLHNPIFLHLHRSPHHSTLHPKPYQSPYRSHPQLSHCSYHPYYPHLPIPCYH